MHGETEKQFWWTHECDARSEIEYLNLGIPNKPRRSSDMVLGMHSEWQRCWGENRVHSTYAENDDQVMRWRMKVTLYEIMWTTSWKMTLYIISLKDKIISLRRIEVEVNNYRQNEPNT